MDGHIPTFWLLLYTACMLGSWQCCCRHTSRRHYGSTTYPRGTSTCLPKAFACAVIGTCKLVVLEVSGYELVSHIVFEEPQYQAIKRFTWYGICKDVCAKGSCIMYTVYLVLNPLTTIHLLASAPHTHHGPQCQEAPEASTALVVGGGGVGGALEKELWGCLHHLHLWLSKSWTQALERFGGLESRGLLLEDPSYEVPSEEACSS